MLIGVDHGNKQIKTVHCNPFVSGLKQSVTPVSYTHLLFTSCSLSMRKIPVPECCGRLCCKRALT